MKCQRIYPCLALLVASVWPVWSQSKDDFFETRIRPILATECFSCHTNSQLGGLRLDSRENVLKGNEEGPVVLLKKPENGFSRVRAKSSGVRF